VGKAEVEVFSDLPPVWTRPDDEWMQRGSEYLPAGARQRPKARTATYIDHAANLLKVTPAPRPW